MTWATARTIESMCASESEARGRPVERPRERRCRNETDRKRDDRRPQYPVRHVEDRQYGLDHLHDQPCTDEVQPRHADHVAALEFDEEAAHLDSVAMRRNWSRTDVPE